MASTTAAIFVSFCMFVMLAAWMMHAQINAWRREINNLAPDLRVRYWSAWRSRSPGWCFYLLLVWISVGPIGVMAILVAILPLDQGIGGAIQLSVPIWLALMAPFVVYAILRMWHIHRVLLALVNEHVVDSAKVTSADAADRDRDLASPSN